MIVVTDGKQTRDRGAFTPLTEASAPLKALKIKIYALGVGKSVDTNELQQIASSPDLVLTATSFKTLDEKLVDLRTAGCKGRIKAQHLETLTVWLDLIITS